MTNKLLYVGAKYDYGDKKRGLSYEHRNFHPSLHSWCQRQGWEMLHYDFYTRGQELGRDLMTQELLDLARREKPAFVFAVLIDFPRDPHHEVFGEIGGTGDTTTLHWFCDDHWRFEKYSRHVAPHFHFVTTTASSALPKYAQIGLADRVIKTQWACNHELYVPHDITPDIDVSFIGQPHGDRAPFLNAVTAQGLPVSTFGFGWQDRPRLPFHQMVRLFSRSKVNLNLSNSSTLVGQQIKGRCFEVAGAGGFLLSGRADNLGEYYQDGQEIATYDSAEELADKARFYLAHDDERRRIAHAGRRRTLAEHTWHHRYDEMFRQMGRLTLAPAGRDAAQRRAETAPLAWRAPIWDATNGAAEARAFVLALDGDTFPVAICAAPGDGTQADLCPPDRSRLERMTRREMGAGGVSVCHGPPISFTRPDGARLHVGRTAFAADGLPDGWAELCNRMDQIWVPSEWHRDTFARAGVEAHKLRVVPAALDTMLFDGSASPLEIAGSRGFNFLALSDGSRRAGWDCLLRAYVEEFGDDEDVCLIVRPLLPPGQAVEDMAQGIDDFIAQQRGRNPKHAPDIVLEATPLPPSAMPRLYAAADCCVLPTRGEGWGRPCLEAMAMGLPTIGTDWGGHRAFMTPDNSFLVPSQVVPVPAEAVQEQPLYQNCRWAEPNVTHLRQLMRQVFSDRDAARSVGARGQADIHRDFCPERLAERVHEAILPEPQQLAA